MNLTDEKWRIWSEVVKFIDESTEDLFCTSDELHKIIFESKEVVNIENLIDELNKKEFYLRIENDEKGFYLSIIDRKIYPRVWADNFKTSKEEMITESTEHLIQRSVSGSEKDWIVRFDGDLQECIEECFKWIKNYTS